MSEDKKPVPASPGAPRLGVLADLFRVKAIFQLRTVEMLLRAQPAERSEAPEPSSAEGPTS